MKPIIAGHRGVAGTYPENTRVSFTAAAEMGLRWIELDVQPTADNQLVVCHDHELERCSNGHGRVDEHPLAALKQLDFGSWFDAAFTGEQIMTLDELLAFIPAHQLAVNIEIKIDEKHNKAQVAQLLYQALTAAGTDPQQVLISSFDHGVLKIFHQLTEKYPLAVLTEQLEEKDLQSLGEINAVACNINYLSLDQSTLDLLHQSGLQVWVYTVNRPDEFSLIHQVDGVFTDYPERFIDVMTDPGESLSQADL